MKANEAPEKLYYAPYGDIREDYPITDNDIEYTRTDAFIEKACEYLMDYEFNDSPTIADRRRRVEEFKKAMKGENMTDGDSFGLPEPCRPCEYSREEKHDGKDYLQCSYFGMCFNMDRFKRRG